MNKRQKKKIDKKKALWVTYMKPIHSQWNTNTPDWKRCKKSGRKRRCQYTMIMMNHYTRNFRTYDPKLFEEAMRKVNFDNASHPIDSMMKELPYTFEIVNDNISRR